MSCGKTVQLIILAYQLLSQNTKVLVAKPGVDTRYSHDFIVSRTGDKIKADCIIDSNFSFAAIPGISEVRYILIDEAQFLDKSHVDQLRDLVNRSCSDITVVCYGLLTDFKTSLFEGSKRLVEVCDEAKEMDSLCRFCPTQAKYNMRTIDSVPVFDGEQVFLGGDESYIPVCPMCYYERRKEHVEENS